MLSGKCVLITGASRGIGLEIAKLMYKNNAEIIITSRNINTLVQLNAQEFENKAKVYELDLSSSKSIETFISSISNLNIDILINNAGIMLDGQLIFMDIAAIMQILQTNLFGTIFLTKGVVKLMIRKRSGKIINIGSIIGDNGFQGQSVYSASKSGLIGFTKSLSKELGRLNITVNLISPGIIETDLISKYSKQKLEDLQLSIALGRIGSTNDIAQCALFLASENANYITGASISVDGGLTI